jgi:hypothetical protein
MAIGGLTLRYSMDYSETRFCILALTRNGVESTSRINRGLFPFTQTLGYTEKKLSKSSRVFKF